MIKVDSHPVLGAPTVGDVEAYSSMENVEHLVALQKLVEQRKGVIAAEKADPLTYGWEPGIWMVPDILMGLPCGSPVLEKEIQLRFGMTWGDFSEGVRDYWGFKRPVRMVLILGANRAAKTQYGAKRTIMEAYRRANTSVHAFHQSHARSVRDHQALVWDHFPLDWKDQTAGRDTYIKWKRKTGFSGDSFIAPNGSEGIFGNYMQDRDVALQGIERDWIWADELVLEDWLRFFLTRLSTRAGHGVATFTPVNGFTPAVQMFCSGGTVVQDAPAFLLPRDGKSVEISRQLGLTEAQLTHLRHCEDRDLAPNYPQSRSEDILAWFEKDGRCVLDGSPLGEKPLRPFGMGNACMPVPDGRQFERVPRVMRCVNPLLGVVWFQSADNPYGNPKNVIEAAIGKKKGSEAVRIECYGHARKTASAQFAQYAPEIHIVPDRSIPTVGRNVHIVDPAGDRNFFMGWVRSVPANNSIEESALPSRYAVWVQEYLYREWPSSYAIPRVGVPESWANPSGRKDGVNDGDRGRGQESFGWGLLRYKFEIARLEGWEAYYKWRRDVTPGVDDVERKRMIMSGQIFPHDAELMDWDVRDGAREQIDGRIMDSRSAHVRAIGVQRPVTLIEDFADLGIDFDPAPGSDVGDGVGEIQTALDWQEVELRTDPIPGAEIYSVANGDISYSGLNSEAWLRFGPRLMVAESAKNTQFSLEYWMNVDGQKGPCKDPIDILRMYLTSEYGGLWRLGRGAVDVLERRMRGNEGAPHSRKGPVLMRAQVDGDRDLQSGEYSGGKIHRKKRNRIKWRS